MRQLICDKCKKVVPGLFGFVISQDSTGGRRIYWNGIEDGRERIGGRRHFVELCVDCAEGMAQVGFTYLNGEVEREEPIGLAVIRDKPKEQDQR